MDILRFCEEYFQFICALNSKTNLRLGEIHQKLRILLKDISNKLDSEEIKENLNLILIYFADDKLKRLHYLNVGNEFLEDKVKGTLAGETDFYEMLRKVEEDNNVESLKLLPVFYQCLALGFYGSPPSGFSISKKMEEIFDKISLMNYEEPCLINDILNPDKHLPNTANYTRCGHKNWTDYIAHIGIVGALLVVLYYVLYKTIIYRLDNSLDIILRT